MGKLRVMTRVVLLAPLLPALGWGAVTHFRINREAYRRALSVGLDLPKHEETYFGAAGTSPDFISIRADILGRHEFDYAHNLFAPDTGEMLDVDHDGGRSQRGRPAFGEALVTATRRRPGCRDHLFALGWTAHQLADRHAHGERGYANTTPPFPGLRELIGAEVAARLGPHGMNEIAVDVLEFNRESLPELTVPVRPCLLYATSRRFPARAAGAVIPPWRSLLMARFWQAVLRGAQVPGFGAVTSLFAWNRHPGWTELVRHYSVLYPYQAPLARAIYDVTQMLIGQ